MVLVIYLDAPSPTHSIVLPSDALPRHLGRVALFGAGIRELSTSEVHGTNVAARPVGSYPTFSPLPASRLRTRMPNAGGYFLLHDFALASDFPLRSGSPFVARTFLSRHD